MRKILQDLIKGKYAVSFTLKTLASMVPREIRWLNKLSVLGYAFMALQFFWYIVKIIFFAMVISWFKPQYNNTGARILLIVITFGIIFFAWWMMKRDSDRKNVLG